MINNDLIGYAAMALLTACPVYLWLKMRLTKQTGDINFTWLSISLVGTALLIWYGWNLVSWPLIIFDGISLLALVDIWVTKYDNRPVTQPGIKPYFLSSVFDQKTAVKK